MLKLRASIRVTALDTLCSAICRIYEACDAVKSDELLKSVIDALGKLSAQMSLSIYQDKIVSDLDNADALRDEALRKFGKLLDGYSVFPIESRSESAKRLLEVYNKYRKTIIDETYATESALIKSLLTDLSESSMVSASQKLDGVPELIDSIRAAEDEFLLANDIYITSRANKLESATSLKKVMIKIVNDQLIPYVNAVSLIDHKTYGALAQQIEIEIQRANS